MTGKFNIQINPELILKLVEPDKYERQKSIDLFQKPRIPRSAIATPEPQKPLQTLVSPETSPPSAPSSPSLITPSEIRAPPKPWHGVREDDELASYRKVAADCEHAVESLRKQEGKEREEVQRRAKELQNKQYRAPEPKPFPCPDEKKACIACLTENRHDILKCQDSIRAYSLCAEQVRQRFVTSGFSSPQVNTS